MDTALAVAAETVRLRGGITISWESVLCCRSAQRSAIIDAVIIAKGPSYAEFARAVAKYPRDELLAQVASMAADEAKSRKFGVKSEQPVIWFSLAGVARTALAECRDRDKKKGGSRRTGVSEVQVARLCHMHLTIEDPPPGDDDAATLLTRIAFEQFPAQVNSTENVERGYLLFGEYAAAVPNMPTADAWEEHLGVRLDEFLRVGFALYLASMSYGGKLSHDILVEEGVRKLWEPLSAEKLFEIIDRHFSQPVDEHRRQTREAERQGQEKWSFNSLVSRPLINYGDRLVCPSPHLLLERISATGIWYVAADRWKSRFTDALGDVFEVYVGDQLRLIDAATTLEQVRFVSNGSAAASCDWFVITDDVLVLVEVKCARPTIDYRTGDPAGLKDTERKLGDAVGQLEETAQLLAQNHPAFHHIPKHLPIRGLIVTLEPFYPRETMREDLVRSDVLPIGAVSAYELELATAALTDQADAGAQILTALTREDDLMPTLTDVANGRTFPANAILNRAWDGWATWAADRRKSR